MCGIAGILGAHPPASERVVSALHHRGPDDHGSFVDDAAALFHCRLSIIDTSAAGHQPMATPDGGIHIIYNGEMYNFAAERATLEARGVAFRSHSDTEVLLRMYEAYGDSFVERVRGMFALAIYDRRGGRGRERLLLARDQLGIKPLLYAEQGETFAFGSELKALLATGAVRPEVDDEALRQLVTYGSVVQPRTILEGVRALLPGHLLVHEGRRTSLRRYWSLGTNRVPELARASDEDVVAYVADALFESVKLQMVSDVPLGAFLSGGIDSSLLVAIMGRLSSDPVRTFSVGYEGEGADIDETDDAARTAAYLGTKHTRVLVSGTRVRDDIRALARGLDQPSVDGANAYFVSWAARQAVTVAISGTGGDELFAGYPWFHEMTRFQAGPLAAAASRLLLSPAFDAVVPRRGGERLSRARAGGSFLETYAALHRIFGLREAAKLIAPDRRRTAGVGTPPARELAWSDELPDAGPVERVSALCLRGYTLNQLLRDIDAMSMAHSLEVRVPMLDPVVADAALSVRPGLKLAQPKAALRGTYAATGAKKILFDVARARKLLPDDMDAQPKRGFAMPFDAWLRGPLREVLHDALSPTATARRGYFDPAAVAGTLAAFEAGRGGWARPWLLMITELWAREVLEGVAA